MKSIFDGAIYEESEKDYKISSFIRGTDIVKDEEFMLNLPTLDIVLDQGTINSCVAHSLCVCNSILEYNHSNKWVNFNPYILYGTRYSDHYKGQGMVPRQALDILRNDGAFFRDDFEKDSDMPELEDFVKTFKLTHKQLCDNAKNYSITGYTYLESTESIKQWLKKGMPVTAMWELYDSFYDVSTDGKVFVPNSDREVYLGNHQMTIIGWTKNNEWVVLNSWGKDCGFKGLYYIPFEYKPLQSYGVTDTIFPSKVKAKNIKLKIGSSIMVADGKVIALDSPPIIENDRTLVPLRAVSETLGAIVEWDPIKRIAIVDSEEGHMEFMVDTFTVSINSICRENDVKSVIINNRTMVPIRIIAETLNCDVGWNHYNKTITIKSK